MNRSPLARSRTARITLASGAVLAAVAGPSLTSSAEARPSAYPMANVQVGANTRDYPSTAAPSDGTVAGPGNVQSSSVKCYQDGQTATGNYTTNRWFIVFVNVNGIAQPQWEFVHASYVYDQPTVRRCVKGQDYVGGPY